MAAVAFAVAHKYSPNSKFPYYLTKDSPPFKKGTICRIESYPRYKQLFFPNGASWHEGGRDHHYPIRLRFPFRLLTLFK